MRRRPGCHRLSIYRRRADDLYGHIFRSFRRLPSAAKLDFPGDRAIRCDSDNWAGSAVLEGAPAWGQGCGEMRVKWRVAVAAMAGFALVAACSSSSSATPLSRSDGAVRPSGAVGSPASFPAHGSVGQVWLKGAPAAKDAKAAAPAKDAKKK